jgi:hypothetical protein
MEHMARQRISVLELCVTRGIAKYGTVKGARVGGRQAAFIYEWGKYLDETGDDPGNALAFAKWANVPKSTAYNRLEEFRELIPEDSTPAKLVGHMSEGAARRRAQRERKTAKVA